MEKWQLEHTAARCRMTLEMRGIEIRVVHDFSEVPLLMGQLGKKSSGILDPRRNVFTRKNSLWMFALADGRPVIGGGVRVDDLGGENLSSFLQRTLPVTFSVKPRDSDCQIFKERISGRVAYFGDLVAETSVGMTPRGKEAIRLFTAYGHYRIFSDFDASYTYCFLRGRDWRRASVYGFLDTDPFEWETDRTMYPDGNPEWIAHLARNRLPSLFKSVSGLLFEPFAKDQESLLSSQGGYPARGTDEREPHVPSA